MREPPRASPDSGLRGVRYRRPELRPFLAAERSTTTIVFGSLLPRSHEVLIQAVFRGSGYLCQALPTPTRENCVTGMPFRNDCLRNPDYFTIGGCGSCRFATPSPRLALPASGVSRSTRIPPSGRAPIS